MSEKNTREKGNFGEDIAVEFLKSYEYGIVARNYYAGHTEIDIIALSPDGETVVFCEVKARAEAVAEKYGRPAAAVGFTKQKNLIYAAKEYMKKNPNVCGDRRCRIDVIEIFVPKTGLPKVRHLKNAVHT